MPTKGRSDDTASSSQAPLEEREGKKLSEISRKLSLILKAIENLTDTIKEQYTSAVNSTSEQLNTALTSLTESLGEVTEKLSHRQEVEPHIGTSTVIEEEAMRTKTRIAKVWDFKLQKRKEAYWGMVKNTGHFEIYQTWIQKQNIVIPKYLQKKRFNNEHPAQQKIREEAVLNDFKTEIELQKLRSSQHEERYKNIDREMEEIIKQKCSGATRKCLIQMWKDETEHNETISKRRWRKNDRWLKEYETSFAESYKDISPFFKMEQARQQPTYAEIAKRSRRPPTVPTKTAEQRTQNRRNFAQPSTRYRGNKQQHNFEQSNRNRIGWQTKTNNYYNPIQIPDDPDTVSDDDSDDFLEESLSSHTLT